MSATTLLAIGGCGLFALSFGGLAFVLLRAFGAGAQAYSGTYSEQTARKFEDLFLFIPPRRLSEIGWAVATGVFLLINAAFFNPANIPVTLLGLALGLSGGMAALFAPNQILVILRARRRRRFNVQLVDALSHMSNALRAGFSINQSFETVVQNGENPIAQEFEVMLQQIRLGMGFNEAMQNMEQRVGSEDLNLVITTIDIARKTGGNLTEVFDRISLTIRERMRIENRVRTLTAQGRLQGIVVGTMPIALAAILTFIKPGMMLPFFQSRTGIISVIAVIIMLICGGLLIRKIIRIDV
jgi:tight adherence protein B